MNRFEKIILPGAAFFCLLSFADSSFGENHWKTYRNEKYGFEVKYPANYTVMEKVKAYGGEKACSIILQVTFTDPAFPKKVYDCCYTKEEIEKYGEIPQLEINVRVADCGNEDGLPIRAKEIMQLLQKKGISQKSLLSAVSLLPCYGETGKNGVYVSKDGCAEHKLSFVNGHPVIESSGCIEGVWENTFATIPDGSEYIIQVSDNASEYSKAGLFTPILSTFRFLK